MSEKDFRKFEKAFEKAWTKETTYSDVKDKWTEAEKSYGQCAPTALVVNDLFGGRMLYDKKNFHIWNELPDGTQQDFSRKQFKQPTVFTIYKYKSKDEILTDENGQRTKIDERYKLLKQRFQEELKNLES